MTEIYVCPHCEKPYTLGVTGTVDGCDICENIIRNTDGTVIDEVDSMTSPENS